MNRKTLTIIQIVLAVIVLAYWVLPDFMLGPLDDGVIAALALIAEVVLFVVRAVKKPLNSSPDYEKSNYQQYYQDNASSNSSDYQQNYQNEEFVFFAGCTNWEQVKSRYRDLMKIYHPDAGGQEEASKRINAEYNKLKKKFGH